MNKELIKSELIRETENLFKLKENTFKQTTGLNKLNAWSEKFEKTSGFTDLIMNKLNEILERHNVEFENETDKKEFIEFINPTIKNLITKFIKN